MNLAEKRKTKRFNGAIPIELKNGSGITRNFNTDGVYFVTDQTVALGEHLEFMMMLSHVDPLGPIRLHCWGDVVRVEPGLKQLGVAVAISEHILEGTQARWNKHTGHAD